MNAQAQARAARAARAEARLQTAHELLRDLDLIARWSVYGEVTVVGSVAIGLVVDPDIDLEIRSDEPRVADGFAVMSVLAELPQVRRITYLDARDRHEQGQYWKLEYETPDDTWTVDMWVFGPNAPSGGPFAEALRHHLTPDTRDTILAIKEEAAGRGERARGYWLYQAVLDGGASSYDEYRAWLGNRNIYERTNWLPIISP
ncbi:hypothetical protein EV651_106189 [Kribbella sp. VKM Ac-2571]|uniref:hypothetical protein n=1 Tax=Kribbella sp. VKM Ac-2571 TaxID=2512222 RepID=UPI0010623785|nr:hypothetical protein [Kribbella sp. VKM Ac-2571]TDO62574.1 hypothetical protein EV651_106189 [Kribbella sp. VKM Ac-2571]